MKISIEVRSPLCRHIHLYIYIYFIYRREKGNRTNARELKSPSTTLSLFSFFFGLHIRRNALSLKLMKKGQRFIRFLKISFSSLMQFFNISDKERLIMNPLDIQQQLADQRRGRYVRVSDVDRRLLIDTYKKGEDFIALAKKLNIKRSTGEKEEKNTPGCIMTHFVPCVLSKEGKIYFD